MSHHCHYPPCQHITEPRLAFCPLHWYALDTERKAAILHTYRTGKAANRHPSRPWLAAMREAMADLFALDGDTTAEAHSRALAARFHTLEESTKGETK